MPGAKKNVTIQPYYKTIAKNKNCHSNQMMFEVQSQQKMYHYTPLIRRKPNKK